MGEVLAAVFDFLPISLVGSVYKRLAKVLENRLKVVLDFGQIERFVYYMLFCIYVLS